jgi:branched-subunit amino acid transport protein
VSGFVALIITAAGTFAIRTGSVQAFQERAMSPVVTRVLRHAALAILASLAVSSLPSAAGGIEAPSLVGLVATVVAARRFSNLAVVMAVGIAAYAGAGAVIG